MLPNLILILCLFGVIVAIWSVVMCGDLFARIQNRRTKKIEPWMTNFTVRFLYEIFFEIILCLMINFSYADLSSSSQVASWIICIILSVISCAFIMAITLLFWRGGPDLKNSYQKRTLIQSIWGWRPINRDHTSLQLQI